MAAVIPAKLPPKTTILFDMQSLHFLRG